jgi:hypothetical protein
MMTVEDHGDTDDRGMTREAAGAPSDERRGRFRLPAALAAGLALALAIGAAQPSKAADPVPVKIAVFDFELDDRSAGGGVIAPDEADSENLRKATEEARRLLAASGRYNLVDTSGTADEVASAGGLAHCNGCESDLARKLGAEQSMAGVVARVSRTEYTLQVVVRDTSSGAVIANAFTGLRMGANYAWPRGARWLMNNRILAAQQAK